VVVVGAFAGLIYLSNPAALVRALSGADYGLIVAGVLFFFAGQLVAALRWYGIVRTEVRCVTRMEIFGLNLIGTFVGNFIPGQGGGDLAKSALLFPKAPDKRAFLLASVIYDRLVGLMTMILLGGGMMLVLGMGQGRWGMYLLILLVVAAVLLALALGRKVWQACFRRMCAFPWLARMAHHIGRFSQELRALFINGSLFARCIGLSLVFQISRALVLWIMLRSILPEAQFLPVIVASPISTLIATLPITFGGLGIREGAFSLLMQKFGQPVDAAAAAALLALIPLFISSAIGALLLGLNYRSYVHRG